MWSILLIWAPSQTKILVFKLYVRIEYQSLTSWKIPSSYSLFPWVLRLVCSFWGKIQSFITPWRSSLWVLVSGQNLANYKMIISWEKTIGARRESEGWRVDLGSQKPESVETGPLWQISYGSHGANSHLWRLLHHHTIQGLISALH